ncbi:MAG: undecaprenyl-phosphate glucose phosphotransferase [Lautropia sp.]
MRGTNSPSLLPSSIVQIRTGSRSVFTLIKSIVDPAIAVICLLAATALAGRPLRAQEMVLAVLVFSLTYPGSVPFRVYTPGFIRQLLGSWGLVIGLLLLFGLMIDTLRQFDQNVLAAWVIATPLIQAGCHWVSPLLLRKLVALRPEQTAIVVAANSLGRTLARSIQQDPLSQTRIMAFFDDRTPDRLGDVLEAPVAGGFGAVAQFVRANRVDQIFIALPMASQPRILRLLEDLRDTTASIYFVPDIFMFDLIQARVDSVGGLPVVAVCESPFYGTTGVLKRLSDILISLVAIILTLPIMLIIALAVRLESKGPVLFKQRRYGLDGSEINVYKFRSMRVQENGDNVRQATKGDDRITRVGRFLRRTSLDELPQFLNVLQGRMSVVGPRPHAVAHNEMYRKMIKGYMIRHKVKPGITGLAQVNGARGETETIEKMEMRIRYDLEYLRHWSLRLDLKIILKTVLVAFRDPNAY